ncbi:MAG: TlyA family RNA methyltransferase [Nitrospirae bacterium]|nr:TlyA family RNA methyltransferase [Nitrospirota bacterium]MBF0541956.1 TlyA family RNA methyltransferase [Nitrospirota bacterium]
MFERGVCSSRQRCKALIMGNKVRVDGTPVTKSGQLVDESSEIVLTQEDIGFVSRGGLKLDYAINEFNVTIDGLICMDVGVSTGGFTDCLLKRGAQRVYAIDVGYGQIAWSIRNDKRVVIFERTNIREFSADNITESINLVVIDVSFISLTKVMPSVLKFMTEGGQIIALIKPQFEVGKGRVGKGGIVRDEQIRASAVEGIKGFFIEIGLEVRGICQSPITGQKGNVEYFIYGFYEARRRKYEEKI